MHAKVKLERGSVHAVQQVQHEATERLHRQLVKAHCPERAMVLEQMTRRKTTHEGLTFGIVWRTTRSRPGVEGGTRRESGDQYY